MFFFQNIKLSKFHLIVYRQIKITFNRHHLKNALPFLQANFILFK